MEKNISESSFRLFLQQELIGRCKQNPQYSLRSFAQNLGIDASTLSQLLAGRRRFTRKSVERLGLSLGLKPSEIQKFYSEAKVREEYDHLKIDHFNATSEWYYDAILELTHLKHFKGDPKWIATVLNVSVVQVNTAVDTLQRLGMLKIEDGQWIDTNVTTTTITDPDLTSAALKQYQKKILELSIRAVEEENIVDRDHTSVCLTIKKSEIPHIKSFLKEFRRQFADFVRKSKPEHDEVYQLSVSFFPLSKNQKKRRDS